MRSLSRFDKLRTETTMGQAIHGLFTKNVGRVKTQAAGSFDAPSALTTNAGLGQRRWAMG
jgi:hypothetical protein